MRSSALILTVQLSALVFVGATVDRAVAQQDVSSQARVSLSRVYPPVYPPIAKTARITGDVKLRVEVQRNAVVSSVVTISGHPLLTQAAIESAYKSTFECLNCQEETSSLDLTYTFLLREDIDCTVRRLRSAKCFYLWKCGGWRNNGVPRPIDVSQSSSRITIVADSMCTDASSVGLARNSFELVLP